MAASKAKVLCNRFVIASRHYKNAARHATCKKLVNLLRNELELRRKKVTLASLPYFIKIEASGTCQLRCPGCSFGSPGAGGFNRGRMLPLDGLKLVVDSLSDALMGINLCLTGEPLLNPRLVEIIGYCSEKNVGTVFPTNLSMKLSQNEIENIVSSGLDHLVVSIDGTTQEVYEKYRKGGNLDLVLKNAAAIIARKKEVGSNRPLMEFKFILFDHNREQRDEASRLSRVMGFDMFSVILDHGSPARAATLDRARARNLATRRACFWPWSSTVICWDGTVWPCCWNSCAMGNAFETPFPIIWNGYKYERLRSFFRTYDTDEYSETCAKCMHF